MGYGQFFELGPQHWAQLVFQCRVRPGSFVVRPGSLANKHWPREIQFDRNFAGTDELEWLVEDPADVRETGFLIREFGPNVDTESYGHLNSLVRDEGCVCRSADGRSVACTCGKGPEFVWTRVRHE